MKNRNTTKIELDVNKNEIRKFLFNKMTIDSAGNILDETEFDPESNIVRRKIYRFFDTGELKQYIEYDPNNNLLERHIYSKDEHGSINKIEYEFIGGQKSILEFSFTDIGNSEKAVIRDENGEITGYELYIFNELNQLIKEIQLDAFENEISRCEKTYYKNGLLSEENQFIEDKLISIESFEYDDNGNILKKIYRDLTNDLEVFESNSYNINQNLIYTCSFNNGVLVFENKCKYNENNELISEEFFELDYWEKKITRHERQIHEYSSQ